MEIDRYYVKTRESIYNLAAAVGLIVSFFLVDYIGSWMLLRDFQLGRIILKVSSPLQILVIVVAAFFLLECFDSRVKPKFSLCPHFLIMGTSNALTISWEEIHRIRIFKEKISVQFEINSRKATRKESIKHVINKEDLVEKIKQYSSKYEIEFSLEYEMQ
ncbi:MAG: hypothetical protein HXS46_19860 [Theionarchaea archaeon]|nr:hypothetical protein [Theionarchaea archaeon]